MHYTLGPAGPTLYLGQRGEQQTASSLDPCAESRPPRWALPYRRLLGTHRWFQPGDGRRLGPLHGPRLWRALPRVTPKRHQKVEPDNLKPHPIHYSALPPRLLIPRRIAALAAPRRWLLVVHSQYTRFSRSAHRPVVRFSHCTFGQCPFVRLTFGLCQWAEREALKRQAGALQDRTVNVTHHE